MLSPNHPNIHEFITLDTSKLLSYMAQLPTDEPGKQMAVLNVLWVVYSSNDVMVFADDDGVEMCDSAEGYDDESHGTVSDA